MASDPHWEASSGGKADHWTRVDRLLQSALEREPAQRAGFLRDTCAGDEALMREVESLLSAHQQAESFLENPAVTDFAHSLVGSAIGPYEVQSLLGRGGMGEVYRATDTRLNRTVAIKFLSAHLSANPELRHRFEREARAVASLNHPHICTLYDVGSYEGVEYLVMEFLEGETLADRLTRGPLPLQLALQYGIELADALNVAHRQGVTHRDVKPGNIVLGKSGSKLLDFGLAKVGAPSSSPLTVGATMPAKDPQTAKGTILGTVQYMAPEQLEGADADARTDIFAFGAVLYEMVTGRKVFEGKSQASLIAAIMTATPQPITTLQPVVPNGLDRLVQRCLAKDPGQRWQSAYDLKEELQWIAGGVSETVKEESSVAAAPRSGGRLKWIMAAVGIVVALMVATFFFARRNTAPIVQEARFAIEVPEGADMAPLFGSAVISPDGSQIVFPAVRDNQVLLYLRSLNALEAQPLAGTEDAHHPFWSPDSRSIGFFAEGKLKTIGISGGQPVTLCTVSTPRDNQGKGGTWNRNGDIIYATVNGEPLYRVSAFGGTPEKIRTLDRTAQEESHRWPYFLPDGRHFIYLVRLLGGKGGRVYAGSLDSSERTLLFEQHESNVIYAPPGYLLFVKDQNLMAQAFDAETLKITGEPVRVASPVDVLVVSRALFSVSETGTLVFHTAGSADLDMQLVRFDRAGRRIGAIGPGTPYMDFRLSPNGQKAFYSRAGVADERAAPLAGKVWILDLASGSQSSFSTDMNFRSVNAPLWSPDGEEVFFGGARLLPERFQSEPSRVYRMPVRGAGKPELVLESDMSRLRPLDITRDGKILLISAQGNATGTRSDLWFAVLSSSTKPQKFLETPFAESEGRFSPDGRWVAYTSDESGKNEVYLRAFPSAENKILISMNGGTTPAWRDDGREIVYLAPKSTLMTVALEPNGLELKPTPPRPLFKLPSFADPTGRIYQWWDVTRDGETFYAIVDQVKPSVRAVLNWTAQLNTKK